MAITQYKVVKAPVQDAERVIGEWLAKGWQPLGAPVMVEPNSSSIFQAMTIGTADGGGGGGPVTIVVADITDATDTGKAVMLAADAAEARTAIGAGTSSLALGTTADTAMAGNTTIPAAPTWANISGKPAIVAAGADQAAARAAIGAGTGSSNLALGATAVTAKAGDWKPAAADISDAGAFGRQLLQATDQAAAKTLLGIE